jgi:hypothetical protein
MHLVEDKLKNPCLDYLRHIVFAPPGATFTAGGKTYSDFASANAAFLGGSLSEQGARMHTKRETELRTIRRLASAV